MTSNKVMLISLNKNQKKLVNLVIMKIVVFVILAQQKLSQ